MKNTLIYISAACFAFTFSTLVYSLFRLSGIFPPIDERTSFALLIISSLITFFIFLTHQLPIESPVAAYILEGACVVAVVVIAGAFFSLFPFNLFYTVATVLASLIAYGFVILLLFLNNKADEQKMNEAIIQRRKRDGKNH